MRERGTERRTDHKYRVPGFIGLTNELSVDLLDLSLSRDGFGSTPLSRRELGLLVYMFANSGDKKVVSPEEILKRVWNDETSTELLWVTMGRLRKGLGKLGIRGLIITIQSEGYQLDLSVLQKEK